MKFAMPLSLNFDDLEIITTPSAKKDVFQIFEDEDSGLGMDSVKGDAPVDQLTPLDFGGRLKLDDATEKVKRPRKDASAKRHLFGGKRHLVDISNTASPKIQRTDNPCSKGSESLKERVSEYSCSQTETTKPEVGVEVKEAVNRLVEDENLTGDGCDTFCLPTVRGKHQDLKSITSETMADVLCGRYDDVIRSCRVIDCRYPYEYDGGHIQGAENLYTQERVLELLQSRSVTGQDGKRDILVFHCEFSSERGPKMSRFLRARDRDLNKHQYPALNFSEVYLLDGGYKAFFETKDCKALCEPMEYKPMLHQEHTTDLRHFRSKSKSWTAGEKKEKSNKTTILSSCNYTYCGICA